MEKVGNDHTRHSNEHRQEQHKHRARERDSGSGYDDGLAGRAQCEEELFEDRRSARDGFVCQMLDYRLPNRSRTGAHSARVPAMCAGSTRADPTTHLCIRAAIALRKGADPAEALLRSSKIARTSQPSRGKEIPCTA